MNTILSDVSSKYNIRFAFNDDLFSQITTSLSYSEIPIDQFLLNVCNKFGLKYKLIGGTYVFYIDDEMKIIEAINSSVVTTESVVDTFSIKEPEIKEYIVSGIVKNSNTGERLNYSKIVFLDEGDATTNEMGYFSKTIETDGEVQLKVTHLGYKQLDTLIVISSAAPIEINLHPIHLIEPLPRSNNLYSRFIASMPEVPDIVVFNPKSTQYVPALEPNDLVNALTLLPGINYLKGTDAGLSIRGGAPSDNLVLIDGIPMIESSHLMGNLSVLNAKFIQQAFVSRGGFGAEYGGRTAGIVDLTGKSGNNKEAVIDFTANLLHTNIYVGLPITDKVSLSGSFKKSFVDVWSAYLVNNFALENKAILYNSDSSDQSSVDLTIVNYSDANVKLSYRPSTRKELTLNYFSSYDSQKRNYIFPTEENHYQYNNSNSQTVGYSLNYKSQTNKGWMNSFSAGFNQLESSSTNEYGKDAISRQKEVKPFFDSDFIQLNELRTNWKSEINGRIVTHKFGGGFNHNSLNYKYEDREVYVVGANNFNDSIASLTQMNLLNSYYQAHISPIKWFSIRGGLRGLYNIEKGDFSIQPRFGIELIPIENLKFHYSGGRYLQHLYLAYRIDSYKNISSIWFIPEHKNQNLDAFHHIIGTRLELKKMLFNVEAYSKNNRNKVYFIGELGLNEALEVVDYKKASGNELNRGIDVFLQYQTKRFKHLVSYSISESFERINGVNDHNYFPSLDHQLHRLRLTEIVNYKGWTASVNWYLASGRQYLLDNSTSSQLNFGQHAQFMQMDVSLVKQFKFKEFQADIGITVLNVLDQKNGIAVKNYTITEGLTKHSINSTTIATSFSPLFYINLRYE
ncbi:MAG: TonB-dependent receptor [Prolixibacteraceae bacterium]|nr:TonB-dependent receptor [Prolixibacteraceae bacterium]